MHRCEMESGTILLLASGSKLGCAGVIFDHCSMATPCSGLLTPDTFLKRLPR